MKFAKKSEKLLKRFVDRLIIKNTRREKLPVSKDIISEYGIKKVLFIRDDRIGDLIVSEPVFRYLRQYHPEVESKVLLGKHNISAFSVISQEISGVFSVKKNFCAMISLIGRLRREHFDLAVDMKDKKSTSTLIIIKLIKAKYSAGIERNIPGIYNFYVSNLDDRRYNIYERTGSLLGLFGIDFNKIDLRPHFSLLPLSRKYTFEILKSDGNGIFAVNLSGSNRSKFWGTENYITFINMVHKDFPAIKILLLATPDYSMEVEEICSKTAAEKSGKFDNFNDYACCISSAKLLLTPDTAAVHLASAFGVKCIALYSQNPDDITKAMPWFPYGIEYRAIGSKTGRLDDILPTEVYEKSRDLFASI